MAESKGKILCPRFDVFIKGSKGILIVDGWDVTELVEE